MIFDNELWTFFGTHCRGKINTNSKWLELGRTHLSPSAFTIFQEWLAVDTGMTIFPNYLENEPYEPREQDLYRDMQ